MDLDTKKNIPGGMFFLDYMYIYDNISVFPAKFVTKFHSKYDYSILEIVTEFCLWL